MSGKAWKSYGTGVLFGLAFCGTYALLFKAVFGVWPF